MNFRDDVLTALGAGEDYHALMEVVRRHRTQGLSVAAAYEVLHGIWLEHGFDKNEAKEGTVQDILEAVMEKVWYGQPVL
jgi:predicted outer membrane lipoprotein